MEQNNRMIGKMFTGKNQKFDTGGYLNIYTRFQQGQVMYTCEFKDAKAHTISAPWYFKYQGYLAWSYPMVLSPTTVFFIPYKKTIGWSMVLTCGIEQG